MGILSSPAAPIVLSGVKTVSRLVSRQTKIREQPPTVLNDLFRKNFSKKSNRIWRISDPTDGLALFPATNRRRKLICSNSTNSAHVSVEKSSKSTLIA